MKVEQIYAALAEIIGRREGVNITFEIERKRNEQETKETVYQACD